MPSTSRGAIPYPSITDPADVPADMQTMADRLASIIAIDDQGTFANLPAAGSVGRYYWATDQGILYRDNGSAWIAVTAAAVTSTIALLRGPAASMSASGSSFTQGVGAVLDMNSTNYDTDGMVSLANDRFTVVRAGIHRLVGLVRFFHAGTASTRVAGTILVNGSITVAQQDDYGSDPGVSRYVSLADDSFLNVGDTIQLWGIHTNTGGGSGTRLVGGKLTVTWVRAL